MCIFTFLNHVILGSLEYITSSSDFIRSLALGFLKWKAHTLWKCRLGEARGPINFSHIVHITPNTSSVAWFNVLDVCIETSDRKTKDQHTVAIWDKRQPIGGLGKEGLLAV